MIKDLDVSILVNNVGVLYPNYLDKISESAIKESIIVNCVPQAVLSKYFIPLMKARNNRSAIITLSSFSSTFPIPSLQIYAATKSYNDYLSKTIGKENPKIDCLSVKPYYVATNMISHDERSMKESCSTGELVERSLRDLGHDTQSWGTVAHHMLYIGTQVVPQFYVDWETSKKLLKPKPERSQVSQDFSRSELREKEQKKNI